MIEVRTRQKQRIAIPGDPTEIPKQKKNPD